MTYRCLFSYYGGKSKIAHKYPAPKYDTVIEPFAGGASYSLLHHERRVVLNELDPTTAAIWHYFLAADIDRILVDIPEYAPAGKRVSDMVDVDTAPAGLVGLLRSAANQSTAGIRATYDVVTPRGARDWGDLRLRLAYWWPKTRHWSLNHGDYLFMPQQTATWFVDPPYFNAAGAAYRQSDVDYHCLSWWCKTRKGQVIACENVGATWLPFQPLTSSGIGGYAKPADEAVWTNA